MIILYLILRLSLVVILAALLWALFKSGNLSEAMATFINGIKEGLKGSGFLFRKNRYPVELYQWIVLDEDYVSDECLLRAEMAPMDIADWMKIGLPGTPEAGTGCGDDCQCQLVLCKKTYVYTNGS